MKNNNNEIKKKEVIEMGKIPKDITSEGNTKSVNVNFKVTPEQKEQLDADRKNGGFKDMSKYIMFKLFGGGAPAITLPEGREILQKLSECADLLNSLTAGNIYKNNAALDNVLNNFG